MKTAKKSKAPLKGIVFDSDNRLLRYLRQGFIEWKNEIQLTLGSDASSIIDEMDIMKPSFLVISWEDIAPEMREDILRKCHSMPNDPKVIALLDENADPDVKPSAWGVSKVIYKPFSAALLRSSLHSLLAGVGNGKRIEGHLKNFSLSSLLQVLHMEKKTCRLELSSGKQRATVWLNNGNVIEAKIDDKKSFEAAMEILIMDIVDVDILPEKKSALKASIKRTLPALLLEAAHRKDHSDAENS
jgi:hypothetical protein